MWILFKKLLRVTGVITVQPEIVNFDTMIQREVSFDTLITRIVSYTVER